MELGDKRFSILNPPVGLKGVSISLQCCVQAYVCIYIFVCTCVHVEGFGWDRLPRFHWFLKEVCEMNR